MASRPRHSHPLGPSLLTNTPPPLGPGGHPLQRPLIDPYRSFSAGDFDDFVDGLTSKIRRVLGGQPGDGRRQLENAHTRSVGRLAEAGAEEDVFGQVQEVAQPDDEVVEGGQSGVLEETELDDEDEEIRPLRSPVRPPILRSTQKAPTSSPSHREEPYDDVPPSIIPTQSAGQLAEQRRLRRLGSSSYDGRLLFRGSVTSEDGDEADGPLVDVAERSESEGQDAQVEEDEDLEEVNVDAAGSSEVELSDPRFRSDARYDGSSSQGEDVEPHSRSRSGSLSVARDRGYSGESDDLRTQDLRAAHEAQQSLGEVYEEYEESLRDDDEEEEDEEVAQGSSWSRSPRPALSSGLGSHATPIELDDSDDDVQAEDDNDLFEDERDVAAQRNIDAFLASRPYDRMNEDDAVDDIVVDAPAQTINPVLDAGTADEVAQPDWGFGARHADFLKRVEEEAAAREGGRVEESAAVDAQTRQMDDRLLRQLLESVNAEVQHRQPDASAQAGPSAETGGGSGAMPSFEDFLAGTPVASPIKAGHPFENVPAPVPPKPSKPIVVDDDIVPEEDEEDVEAGEDGDQGYTRSAEQKGKDRRAEMWGDLIEEDEGAGGTFGAFGPEAGGLMRHRSSTPAAGRIEADDEVDGIDVADEATGRAEEDDAVDLLNTGSSEDEEELHGLGASIAESFDGTLDHGHIQLGADDAVIFEREESIAVVLADDVVEESGMESSRAASSEPFAHFSPFSQGIEEAEDEEFEEQEAAEEDGDVKMDEAVDTEPDLGPEIHSVVEPGEYDRSMPLVFGDSPAKPGPSAVEGLRGDIFPPPRKANSTQGVTFAELPDSSRGTSPPTRAMTDGGRSGPLQGLASPGTSHDRGSAASITSDQVTSRDPVSFPASSAPSSYTGSRSPSPAPSMAPPPPLQSAAMGAPDAAVGYAKRSSRSGSADSSVNVEPPSPSISARQSGAPISNEQINRPGLPHIDEALEGTPPADNLPDPRKPPPPAKTSQPQLSDIPQIPVPGAESQASSIVAQPPSPPRSAVGPVDEATLAAVDVNQPGLPHPPASARSDAPLVSGTSPSVRSEQRLTVFSATLAPPPEPAQAPPPARTVPYPPALIGRSLVRTASDNSSLAVLPPSPRSALPGSATPVQRPDPSASRAEPFDPSKLSHSLDAEQGSDEEDEAIGNMLLETNGSKREDQPSRPSLVPRRSTRLRAREPTADEDGQSPRQPVSVKHGRTSSVASKGKADDDAPSQARPQRPSTPPARPSPPRRRLHQHGTVKVVIPALTPKSSPARAPMPRRSSNAAPPSVPVTRSHCSYIRVDFPADLDGPESPMQRFLVPQCSVAGREKLMSDERLVSAGEATPEEQARAKLVAGDGRISGSEAGEAERLGPRTWSVLVRLVGTDLVHEGQVEILPMPAEEKEARVLAEVHAGTDEQVEEGLNQAMEDGLPSPPKKRVGSPANEEKKRKRDEDEAAAPPKRKKGWFGGLFG